MTGVQHRISRLRDIANMLREEGYEGWASELGQTAELLHRMERSEQDTQLRIAEVHEHYRGWTPPYSKYCAQPAEPPRGEM